MARQASIVVGWDGSSNSVAALNCALVEADLRKARLVLCHVRERSGRGPAKAGTVAAARRLLDDGADHARRRLPGVVVTSALVTGSPSRELLRLADDARLLVVGARGASTSHQLRLGPVSDHVARHARRAVLVVPSLGGRAGDAHRRVVVVGVDGSSGSAAAVRFAFEEAVRRQAAVRAIHVVDPSAAAIPDLPPESSHERLRRLRLAAADTTRALLAGHAARHPAVRVCVEIRSGAPGVTLAAAAHGCELLVLGAHGRRDAAALASGITRSAVLHAASCPVAIV